jgi:hypothetical protein
VTNRENDGWIKSSASSDGGECVEMRRVGLAVQVRDSKLGTDSPIHTLTPTGCAIWLDGAKKGEYDSLT